jgi:demethylmenaquinone methyltransferase/2-methoxy-6-polyprenyl-1,4-benzoquinol methylase
MRDPELAATLAAKAGLTGNACAYDADEDRVHRGAAEIERAGALVECTRAPWGLLPYDDASFDVAVARDVLHMLPIDGRARCLSEVRRVLRPGGRIIVIEPAPRAGIGALLSRATMDPTYVPGGGALSALQRAGFVAARVLAERDGVLYTEGARSGH